MKRFSLLLGLLLVLVLSACAAPVAPVQNSPAQQVSEPLRTISVNGTGQVTLNPDLAYVYIGVQSQSEQVADALTQNNDKAKAVASSLRDLGIEEKDIQTSSFNIYPQQQYGPNGEVTSTIYMVNNTVNVTVRDLQLMGRLLDVVVRTGANSINGVTFDVQDKSKAIAEARKLAIESARGQADEMAQTAGVTLGDLQTMSVYSSQPPVAIYDAKNAMGTAASQVPVSAGQLVIQVEVSATYFIK
ncbi:MAG: SIMPL domain-containing protein [Anaerolineaceae bacterium]|nr:SIMPL domain-containing protein [Anaerolineaceae bacterium]